jgi:hypothetical protein
MENGDNIMDVKEFWIDVLKQNREKLISYFHKDAVIRWHCSNELFTVSEYIKANCEYPGEWEGKIERIEKTENMIITAVRVYSVNKSSSFHVVSFIKTENNLITEMDEYLADDTEVPEWRHKMKIGSKIWI